MTIDLRHALRTLFRPPLVTAVAILSLALGIGANAAIFSIFERLILRPLPVEAPQELVNLVAPGPKSGSISANNAGSSEAVFSYPMFRDLGEAAANGNLGLVGLAAHRSFGANLAYSGNTSSGSGMLVSGSYFDLLGLEPAAGRLLTPSDDGAPGANPVVVLSHAYWKREFDQRSDVVGTALVVNGNPMTIVGVAPPRFDSTTLGEQSDIFVPISMRGKTFPGWDGFDNRRDYWAYLFGRLAPGTSIEDAMTAINVPFSALIQEVEAPLHENMSDDRRARFLAQQLVLEPGAHGQSDVQGEARTPLLLLLAVTGLVLLIACANVANLLLTKATHRAREIAIRMSIGAQRRQVVVQLLTESLLLAVLGGALGLLFAHWTLRLIISLLPVDGTAELGFEIGPATWVFLALLSLVTSLVGLFPALSCTRHDLVASLSGASFQGSSSRSTSRFRAAMATLQIALSMTLLISAGLFTRSLLNVSRVDLGIETQALAMFGVSPELSNYSPEESRALFERIEDELAALPGVASVTASMVPLVAGSNWGTNVSVQGFEDGPDVDSNAKFNEIGPGFFRTLGVPLLLGREFERRDTLDAPEVAIVNQAFTRKFGLGDQVVGKRMAVGSGDELDIEIVGLVPDTSYSDVKSAPPPVFFLPYRQDEELGSIFFYVRGEGDPAQLLPSVRGVVSRLDPNLPLEGLGTLDAQIREGLFLDRMLTTLSAAFAVLATLLAAIGLYGVLAYSVAQRTREIGLRMALGADRTRVRGMIQRQVSWLTIPGALIGIAVAIGVGRLARSLLYELEGHDPVVFAAAALLLLATAFLAGMVPARRAARIDPMTALRDD